MARIRGLTANQIAKRIYNREDNVYDKKVITKQLITNILLMYMDECRKALAEGERIEISKVGSIIPEVKVHEGNFNLPMCNKDGGNPPYTKLRIRRNNLLVDVMNNALIKNMVLVRKWGDCLKQAKSTVTHYPSPHRSYAVCLWCLLVKACCITALPYLQYAYKQS